MGFIKVAAFLAGALHADSARTRRKSMKISGAKLIADVPVYNYHMSQSSKSRTAGKSAGDVVESWVVMAEPGTTDAQLDAICKHAGCEGVGHPSEGGVAYLTIRGTEKVLQAFLEKAPGLAKFVEPDIPVSMIPEIEDEQDRARSSEGLWGLERIGAAEESATGAGVNVYVLDTGVRISHSEFGGRAVPGFDAAAGNVECNGDAGCAADNQGHGTHCAGTVAGKNYGVAPSAKVYGVKVLSDSGAGQLGWMVSGLDYVATKGMKPAAASMSLGAAAVVPSFEAAVDAAVAQGVSVVVAAGNSNDDACGYSPAFVPSAVTVGSTASDDTRSFFSNWGSCVDIWAPGSAIKSASHEDDTGAKTFSGTSMACPHVSGAVARVLERNPSDSPDAVLQKMLGNAATNYISDLTPLDANKLLWVGASAPPLPGGPPPPTRPAVGPCESDTSGNSLIPGFPDCACNWFKKCYRGDEAGCPCSMSADGCSMYFVKHCSDCVCK